MELGKEQSKLQELEEMYRESQSIDKNIFAEMRTYVLLKGSEHYSKKWMQNYIRSKRADMPEEMRIRLTKNDIQKIIKLYVGNLVGAAPGAQAMPNNEKEQQDQKSAELHQAVLSDIKRKHGLPLKLINYADDYVTLGEVIVFVGWDWEKGYFKREEPELDEMGFPKIDPLTGEVSKMNPVFSGSLTLDRIFAPDLFRPIEATELKEAPWVGVKKMMNIKTLKRMYKDQPDKLKLVSPSNEQTFVVFDSQLAQYTSKKNQMLVKQVFYKPCMQYPKGYFYYFVEGGILEEGELPGGIWPFVIETCEEMQTSARGVSPVKHWKPYQVELNRIASKIAEHQITLGDDKLIIPNGAKLSQAGTAPGIRAYSSSGTSPTVIPGRSGEQYLPHAQATRTELYDIAMVSEELQDKVPGQVDPYSLLLQSAKWKKKFATNITKFENFVVNLYEKALEVTRYFIEEDEVIPIIGRAERVNITEFKNSKNMYYQIKLEPQTEDLETRLGKKLSIDRYLQYAGTNLSKEDVGKFIRLDPYLNKEELLSDFTLDYDNAVNMILALDRGEQVGLNESDNLDYLLKKLSNRQRSADFQFLPEPIQTNYAQVIQQIQGMKAQQVQQQMMAQQGFIPAQGMLVTCDLYTPDPKDPSRQVRLRLPYDSLQWLQEKLATQGQTQEALAMQSQGQISEILGMLGMQQPNQGSPQIPQGMDMGQAPQMT